MGRLVAGARLEVVGMFWNLRFAGALISAAVLTGCGAQQEVGGAAEKEDAKPLPNSQGYSYVAPDPAAYKPAAEIQKWVDGFDVASIEAHAWDLWTAINAPSGQYHQSGDVKVEVAVWGNVV